MHSRAVIAENRLRHKGCSLPEGIGCVLYNVLEEHYIVGSVEEVRKSKIDLALSGGRNFVVMTFDVDADLA